MKVEKIEVSGFQGEDADGGINVSQIPGGDFHTKMRPCRLKHSTLMITIQFPWGCDSEVQCDTFL